MKSFVRTTAVYILALALILAPGAFAVQSESHVTIPSVSASLGHNPEAIQERLVPQNMVNITARHCQKYAREDHGVTVIDDVACALDPLTAFYTHTDHNLRTNAGSDAQSSQMGNTSTQAAACNYIAVSNDATAPSATDTTLASEIATNGFTRAQGTYAHTTGASSFTIQKVFTATATQASQKTGLFNAASSGTLCFENTYTQVTANNGDTLTVTWTINF